MAGDMALVIGALLEVQINRQEDPQARIPAQDQLVGDHLLVALLNPEAGEAAAVPDRNIGLIEIDGGRRAPVFLCTRRGLDSL